MTLLRSIGDPDARERRQIGVQTWAEAVRSPRIRDLVRGGVDEARTAAAAFIIRQAPDTDAAALARVLIAIYQGLLPQTVWDDSVDNAALRGGRRIPARTTRLSRLAHAHAANRPSGRLEGPNVPHPTGVPSPPSRRSSTVDT
ncbi:hypothetical protein GCM10010172_77230 [Paractinoplanes ferrugineus]|uniref:BetI-type transcriptional repressor C-terminal domain-containing protein n=1 Tax=Paractinoplanes ferrugineus TaxID=113564 RepID=A0A919MM21_9ACTN|nr:TetR family transcriptional regulator C-terminal domain-containing protein [Actinoplanes ferrugineus]GIE12797.1 hypothetical protein Afe05nite_46370 [Actinoplanes ferrugineus]